MPSDRTAMPSIPSSSDPSAQDRATGLILANLRTRYGPRLAVRVEQGLLAVTVAARELGLRVPRNTDELIAAGEGQLRLCMAQAFAAMRKHWLLSEDAADFAPCIVSPQKIICVGLNYRQHAREVGLAEPKVPILFSKFNNALTHHRAIVPTKGLPGRHLDYEGELVVVMGRRCEHASVEKALDSVFGYCVGNDLSERSSQLLTSQWLAGKTSDGFAPIGPYLVRAPLVGDPNQLRLETRVNGELRQSSSTADFIFNCQNLVAYCSALFPLEPGDLIFTGTPEGVVLGMAKERQVWLKPGDVVATTIEKLGTLQFTLG